MRTKYTNGPWEIREDIPYSTAGFVIFNGSGVDNKTIARLPFGRTIPQPEDSEYLENKANAKLIATSPDMICTLYNCIETINILLNSIDKDSIMLIHELNSRKQEIENTINKAIK